jgi:hypothetical protein
LGGEFLHKQLAAAVEKSSGESTLLLQLVHGVADLVHDRRVAVELVVGGHHPLFLHHPPESKGDQPGQRGGDKKDQASAQGQCGGG